MTVAMVGRVFALALCCPLQLDDLKTRLHTRAKGEPRVLGGGAAFTHDVMERDAAVEPPEEAIQDRGGVQSKSSIASAPT